MTPWKKVQHTHLVWQFASFAFIHRVYRAISSHDGLLLICMCVCSASIVSKTHWYTHIHTAHIYISINAHAQTSRMQSIYAFDCVDCSALVCMRLLCVFPSIRIVKIEVVRRCIHRTYRKPPQKMTGCAILSCASINTPLRIQTAFHPW